MGRERPLGRPPTRRQQSQAPIDLAPREPIAPVRLAPRLAGDAARESSPPRAKPKTSAPKKATNRRITKSLVALGSLAILSVYGVGYVRTQSAADAIAAQETQFASASASANVVRPTPVATIDAFLAATAVPTVAPAIPTTVASENLTRPADTVLPTSVLAQPAAASPAVIPTPRPAASATRVPTPTDVPTVALTATTATKGLKDGTYVGSGDSRHGGIEATVVVRGGKIVSADVTSCGTRYPCSRVQPLVDEVVASQAPPVDLVSGATDSSYAYVDAVTQALAKAT